MCVCVCVCVHLIYNVCIYIYIERERKRQNIIYNIYEMEQIFFFHHTTCEITCDSLSSSAANQGDNTVSVVQVSTATPGATKSGSTALSYRNCYHPGWLLIYYGPTVFESYPKVPFQ